MQSDLTCIGLQEPDQMSRPLRHASWTALKHQFGHLGSWTHRTPSKSAISQRSVTAINAESCIPANPTVSRTAHPLRIDPELGLVESTPGEREPNAVSNGQLDG